MKKAIILIFFLVGVSTLYAQDETPRTDKREKRQRARIREGENSGELTKSEKARLKAEQLNIRRMERRAKKDGLVTVEEQAKIDRKQNRASKDIRRAKHNKKKPH
jgi:hypothetical protein